MFPLGQSYWFGFEFLSHSWSIGVVHFVVGSILFIFWAVLLVCGSILVTLLVNFGVVHFFVGSIKFLSGQSYWFGVQFLSHSWSIGVVVLCCGFDSLRFGPVLLVWGSTLVTFMFNWCSSPLLWVRFSSFWGSVTGV